SGADIVMLDTFVKDEKGLFDFLNVNQLTEFRDTAYSLNLKIALAGNLKENVLNKVREINPDIIGVRSMVCEGHDREHGSIKIDLIDKLKSELYK
ncbi:MAG: (5-formylfuran-3-yl)methyl phosphate synthase, partial [Promethearchaeota archaeon]